MKKAIFGFVCLLGVSSIVHAVGGSSTAGGGNPAEENCIKLGGSIEPFATPSGADNNCAIGQWQLYKVMDEHGLITPHHYDHGVPNPAAVNCIDIGGKLRPVVSSAGEDALCIVEEWALLKVIDVTH